MKKIPGISIN